MKRSTNRILTTHAGRLNGPDALTTETRKIQRGEATDIAAIEPLIRTSMAGVIKQQAEAGIDIISDGELGKVGFGLSYYGKRLTGLGTRPVAEGEAAIMSRHDQRAHRVRRLLQHAGARAAAVSVLGRPSA